MSAELFAAIRRGDAAAVERLVDGDGRLATACDEGGVSAVLTAYYHGHPNVATALMRKHPGLDVFEAATAGDADRVRSLLDRTKIGRSDPTLASAYNVDGFHPLGLAAFFRRKEVVRLLIERGADVGAPAKNRLAVTALHSALATDVAPVDRAIVRMLLDAGAPVNARHLGGGTPLHTAAFNGDLESIRMLLDRGADVRAKTDDGKTPIDVARDRGQTEAAHLLERAGPV